jgi:hypothetical protein
VRRMSTEYEFHFAISHIDGLSWGSVNDPEPSYLGMAERNLNRRIT